jgi:hypothetical protein
MHRAGGCEDKQGVEKEAWNRYSLFVDYVSRQLAGGQRVVNDLVDDVVPDDEELKALLDEVCAGRTGRSIVASKGIFFFFMVDYYRKNRKIICYKG